MTQNGYWDLGSGTYLDVDGDGSQWDNVIIRGYSADSESPLWNIDEVSVDNYAVRSLNGGTYLNVVGGWTSNGANVHLWDSSQSNHSLWQLQRLRALPGVLTSTISSSTSATMTTTGTPITETTYSETHTQTSTSTQSSTTNPYHAETISSNECSSGYDRILDEATCITACAAATDVSYQRAWKWANDPAGCFVYLHDDGRDQGCYFNEHVTGASHPQMYLICQISATPSGSE